MLFSCSFHRQSRDVGCVLFAGRIRGAHALPGCGLLIPLIIIFQQPQAHLPEKPDPFGGVHVRHDPVHVPGRVGAQVEHGNLLADRGDVVLNSVGCGHRQLSEFVRLYVLRKQELYLGSKSRWSSPSNASRPPCPRLANASRPPCTRLAKPAKPAKPATVESAGFDFASVCGKRLH